MSDSTEMPPQAAELAHQLFDLARTGESTLLAYVDRGAPVDLTDAAGNTLLMTAVHHGHTGLVTGLAERGADVDALNDRGESPLAGAVSTGADDVVHALVEAGADPHRGSPSGLEAAHSLERADLADVMLGHSA